MSSQISDQLAGTYRMRLARVFMDGSIDAIAYCRLCEESAAVMAQSLERVEREGRKRRRHPMRFAFPAVAATPSNDFPAQQPQKECTVPVISRACGVCLIQHPRLRSVFNVCRHAICRECADQMKKEMNSFRLTCPFCRESSSLLPLHEDF